MFPKDFGTDSGVFICSAYRKKYMDSETLARIKMNQESSMAKKIYLRKNTPSRIVSAMRELTDTSVILTVDDQRIPEDSLVVYVSTGKADNVKAYMEFKKSLSDVEFEIMSKTAIGSRDFEHAFHRLNKIDSIWYSSLQKCSKPEWIDYDIDIENPESEECSIDRYREYVSETMDNITKDRKCRYLIINTHGGVHILLHKKDAVFSKDFNPKTIELDLQSILLDITKEVKINSSNMVPCPGTFQGGYLVNFKEVNKMTEPLSH